MSKIKEVVRLGLPETNSSSSHSIVISLDSSGIVPKEEWGLDIDEDLILRIPIFNSFDRNNFRSNKVLTKLQYLSCYFMQGYYANLATFKKKAHKFKQVIKDILGVKGVIFTDFIEWETTDEGELYRRYVDFPVVDHESWYVFSEILESEETIKNFLLNRKTWIYGGGDGFRDKKSFYLDTEKDNKIVGCFSCYLDDSIGRVDIEIPEDYLDDIYKDSESTIKPLHFLDNFYYNFESREFEIELRERVFSLYEGPYKIIVEDGQCYITFNEPFPFTRINLREEYKAPTEPRIHKVKAEFKLYDYGIFQI